MIDYDDSSFEDGIDDVEQHPTNRPKTRTTIIED